MASEAAGVILLSGNVHFSEISRTSYADHTLVDFTSSGLTHVKEEYAQADNPYRVAGPYVAENFGLVEIEWGTGGAATVILRGREIERKRIFEYSLGIATH